MRIILALAVWLAAFPAIAQFGPAPTIATTPRAPITSRTQFSPNSAGSLNPTFSTNYGFGGCKRLDYEPGLVRIGIENDTTTAFALSKTAVWTTRTGASASINTPINAAGATDWTLVAQAFGNNAGADVLPINNASGATASFTVPASTAAAAERLFYTGIGWTDWVRVPTPVAATDIPGTWVLCWMHDFTDVAGNGRYFTMPQTESTVWWEVGTATQTAGGSGYPNGQQVFILTIPGVTSTSKQALVLATVSGGSVVAGSAIVTQIGFFNNTGNPGTLAASTTNLNAFAGSGATFNVTFSQTSWQLETAKVQADVGASVTSGNLYVPWFNAGLQATNALAGNGTMALSAGVGMGTLIDVMTDTAVVNIYATGDSQFQSAGADFSSYSLVQGLATALTAKTGQPWVAHNRSHTAGTSDAFKLNFTRFNATNPNGVLLIQVGTQNGNGASGHSGFNAQYLDETWNDAQAMIDLWRARGLPVVLVGMPPNGGTNATTEAYRAAMNARVARYIASTLQWSPAKGAYVGLGVVPDNCISDGGSPPRILPYFDSGDGTHPSTRGWGYMGWGRTPPAGTSPPACATKLLDVMRRAVNQ